MNPSPLITLTSDFGVQSQGVGTMEATAYAIAPKTRVIHLMHGLPEFDIIAAARTLESLRYFPLGNHVCVCDPGVGTDRKPIILRVGRGDYLIGPDNGVLIPATRLLGGILEARQITNGELMRNPVSAIFHGRDIFVPAAAHLSLGVPLEQFGTELSPKSLAPGAYDDAFVVGKTIHAKVIQINRFGSLHLNVLHEQWDELGYGEGMKTRLELPRGRSLLLPVGRTFSDVPTGQSLIIKDDYGRVEIAKNLGSFVTEYPVKIGDQVLVNPGYR